MEKDDSMVVYCAKCRMDVSNYFGKLPLGVCDTCQLVYCINCLKSMNEGKCLKCKLQVKLVVIPISYQSPYQNIPRPNPQPTQQTFQFRTKYCMYCGKSILFTANYCDGCGKKQN